MPPVGTNGGTTAKPHCPGHRSRVPVMAGRHGQTVLPPGRNGSRPGEGGAHRSVSRIRAPKGAKAAQNVAGERQMSDRPSRKRPKPVRSENALWHNGSRLFVWNQLDGHRQ